MEHGSIGNIAAVMGYVEIHLDEKLDLKTVAEAAHYSKYHLHRMFTKMVGMTLHDYIQRRRLSEAAKYLAFSRKPLLEIALIAGYESQQAFTGVFKAMYKQTPLEYREKGAFYPLQSAFTLNRDPSAPEVVIRNIAYAAVGDIPDWMEFISLVIDGFPCLDRARHLKRLRRYVEQRQALLARDKEIMVGAAAFSPQTGRIDFLGIHPQYRRHGIAEAFLDRIRRNEFRDREVSVTTFREGDKADTGQRAAYRRLGFAESELLTEFGYPVQRLVLRTDWEGVSDE